MSITICTRGSSLMCLRVRDHVPREAVHDEHLRRKILVVDELVEKLRRVVDVRGVERADLRARHRRRVVCIENSGSMPRCTSGRLRNGSKSRQLLLQRALADLDVEEEQRVPRCAQP